MRGIFRDMQKERVREMKQKLKEGGERPQKGGYVGKCLVKVEGVGKGEGEDIITVNAVKVKCCGECNLFNCVLKVLYKGANI